MPVHVAQRALAGSTANQEVLHDSHSSKHGRTATPDSCTLQMMCGLTCKDGGTAISLVHVQVQHQHLSNACVTLRSLACHCQVIEDAPACRDRQQRTALDAVVIGRKASPHFSTDLS